MSHLWEDAWTKVPGLYFFKIHLRIFQFERYRWHIAIWETKQKYSYMDIWAMKMRPRSGIQTWFQNTLGHNIQRNSQPFLCHMETCCTIRYRSKHLLISYCLRKRKMLVVGPFFLNSYGHNQITPIQKLSFVVWNRVVKLNMNSNLQFTDFCKCSIFMSMLVKKNWNILIIWWCTY